MCEELTVIHPCRWKAWWGPYDLKCLKKMLDDASVQQPMDGKSFTLLLLPIRIRIKIYHYCGLIRPCPIDLNIEPIRQRWSAHDLATRQITCLKVHHCQYLEMRLTTGMKTFDSHLPPGLDCFCPSIPHELLRVSRAMHLEAETVLYGMNQFKVSRHLPGDNLEVLRALNPRVWALLSSLHISLSEVPPFRFGAGAQDTIETIDIQDMAGYEILQKWMAVSRDILSYVPAGQLRFSLSCNVRNIETSREIVAPLDGLPPMSEVSICLAADPKRREIKEVAREAISRLTQRGTQREPRTAASRSSSLSWTSLPKELRLDILSGTDLVDHYTLAKPQHHSFRRQGFEIAAGDLLPRGTECCYNCTPTLSTCACSPIHAAFATSCTCATVPAALFSVSKDMNTEATVTFFSRNRFILSGDFTANVVFIQSRLVPNVTAASCIRMLDLEISFVQLYDMRDQNSPTAHEWAALVACVAFSLPLPKLWLSIDAGGFPDHLDLLNNDGHHDYSWLRTAYTALFAPLYEHMSGERRPKKFHVYLCEWTDEEEKVEKKLMGGEYESAAEGKLAYWERHPRYPHSAEMGVYYWFSYVRMFRS